MSLIDNITTCRSLSVIGLAKNAGKTECLNYILSELKNRQKKVAVTSIGLDGEATDALYGNAKPDIRLYEGMVFHTAEKLFRQKRLDAEILEIDDAATSLGRIVTARAISEGKVMLAGPPDTATIKNYIDRAEAYGAELTLIDGALSRTSPASPAVSEALILATGASVSSNPEQLVAQTEFMCRLIDAECADETEKKALDGFDSGIWVQGSTGIFSLQGASAFDTEGIKGKLRKGGTVFVAGVLTDRLLSELTGEEVTVMVKDFTKVFASRYNLAVFAQKGGALKVLHKSRLLGVCVNPCSPQGRSLDSAAICRELETKIDVPVFDVRTLKKEI